MKDQFNLLLPFLSAPISSSVIFSSFFRWKDKQKRILEFVSIKRKDCNQCAIPGVSVQQNTEELKPLAVF